MVWRLAGRFCRDEEGGDFGELDPPNVYIYILEVGDSGLCWVGDDAVDVCRQSHIRSVIFNGALRYLEGHADVPCGLL